MKSVLPYRIILYPPVEWGGLFQRPHHLAVELSRIFRKVHFIQPAGLRNPVPGDLGRLRNFIFSPRKRAAARRDCLSSLVVNRLPFLPFHGLEPFERYNAAVFSRFVKRTGSPYAGMVLWIGSPAPFLERTLDVLNPALVVFDWMDDYSIFSHLPSRIMDTQYRMLKRADAVFASSVQLMRRAEALRKERVYYLPNGVDPGHWAGGDFISAADKRTFGTNVIGYFGTISHWMDAGLVKMLAEKRTDWNFVFVGPRADAGRLDALFELPNCRHVPQVPYERLPVLAAGFDVCWLPFRRNGLVGSVNPVKIYEYLAMGKPVVSIFLPDLGVLSDAVTFADSAASFEKAISMALDGKDDESAAEKRRKVVGPYSWKALARQAAGTLERLLHGKQPHINCQRKRSSEENNGYSRDQARSSEDGPPGPRI